MKKLSFFLLAAVLCCTAAVPASAADIITGGSKDTTLTYSVEADYIVTIPEQAEIKFDVESNPIGDIEYQSGNLEPDAFVAVELSEKSALANQTDDRYTIPYQICSDGKVFEKAVYTEDTAAGTKTPLTADITKAAWEDARVGKYEATLTFTISYNNPHE